MEKNEEKKRNWWKVGCLSVIGVVVLLSIIGAIVGEDNTSPSVTAVAGDPEMDIAPADADALDEVAGIDDEPATRLSGPQRNAARSAEQYLSISGFSREGLIEQLSSDAGDGYDREDATVAVDSLNANWNEQAARSAEQYLSISGFSCNGLTEQLSSSAGDKYTREQATYGAEQAGAC